MLQQSTCTEFFFFQDYIFHGFFFLQQSMIIFLQVNYKFVDINVRLLCHLQGKI